MANFGDNYELKTKSDTAGLKDAAKESGALGKAIGSIGKIGAAPFNAIKNGIGAIGGALGKVTKGLAIFGLAMRGLKQLKQIFSFYFDALAKASPAFAKAFDGIKTKLSGLLTPILEKLGNALAPVLEKIAALLDDPRVKKFINDFINFLITAIPQLVGFITNQLVPAIQSIVQWLSDKLAPIFQAISKFIQDNWPAISKLFTDVGAAVGAAIDGIITIVGGLLTFIGQVFSGDWKGAWQTIGDTIKNVKWQDILDGVVNIIKGIWGLLGAILKEPFFEAGRSIMMLAILIERVFTDMVNGLIDGINGFVEGALRAFAPIAGFLPGGAMGLFGIKPLSHIPYRNVILGTGGGFAVGLANGGIVQNPTLAMVGDAPKSKGGEVIAPLSDLMGMIQKAVASGVSVNVYGPFGDGYSPRQAGEQAGSGFVQALRAQGIYT